MTTILQEIAQQELRTEHPRQPDPSAATAPASLLETQLQRLEYRLIILSLIQGQGRPYLNRMERMQLEDILHSLTQSFPAPHKSRGSKGPSAAKASLHSQVERCLIRLRGALQKLAQEPCDLRSQNILQETGNRLIPLIRQQLSAYRSA